jgi:hypothetical protein
VTRGLIQGFRWTYLDGADLRRRGGSHRSRSGTLVGTLEGSARERSCCRNRWRARVVLDGATISEFDPATFVLRRTMRSRVSGMASSLVAWVTDGLAFRTDADQVILVRTSGTPSTTVTRRRPRPHAPPLDVRELDVDTRTRVRSRARRRCTRAFREARSSRATRSGGRCASE